MERIKSLFQLEICPGDIDAPADANLAYSHKDTHFNEQRAITLEGKVRFGPLSNLKTLWSYDSDKNYST